MKQDTLVILMLVISAVVLGGMLFSSDTNSSAHASGAGAAFPGVRYDQATLKIGTDDEMLIITDTLTKKMAYFRQNIRNKGGVVMAKNPVDLGRLFK